MKSAVFVVAVSLLGSCGKAADKQPTEGSAAVGASEPKPTDTKVHFDFRVDGKTYSIAANDISSSYNDSGKTPTFKIFAGADGAPGVTLTVNKPMTGPSSTPSGSAAIEEEISQGSVSLQNFPEKNYTTNSFNTTYPEMSVPVPDAVVITEITADGKDAKLITGTFKAHTYASHSKDNKDPNDIDHDVAGSFRIRHEMTSARF
ncbi:MAG TPA: hypothetical protein VGM39_04430 [Kofleriaceae bacterium]|jgi:hypothetical protein